MAACLPPVDSDHKIYILWPIIMIVIIMCLEDIYHFLTFYISILLKNSLDAYTGYGRIYV